MAESEVAPDKESERNSSLVQLSPPAPNAVVDTSPSDPNLVSTVSLKRSKSRCVPVPSRLN